MSAPAVLAQLKAAGISLSARGGNIVASPRAAVTPEVLELLRTHKQELLAAIEPHPLIARAIDMLRERQCDRRVVVGRPLPDGRCLVAVAIRLPDDSIDSVLLDALIDPLAMLELAERHGNATH